VPLPEFELVCVFGRHTVALPLDVNDAGRSSTHKSRSTGPHPKGRFQCITVIEPLRLRSTAAGKGEVIVQGDSAVAADRFLHARQTFAQVIGIHDRHEFDLGVHTKEEPLGGIGNLR
jgi:hypothetical protein